MSNNKSAYGEPASDTSFRKGYDLDEYAAKAKTREADEREERKARYEAKLAGKKYYKPMTGDEVNTSARRVELDLQGQVGKTTLVPAGAGVGKRGRGAGFYCSACDLTFKDNVQWVEHINSKQHLSNTGQTSNVTKASAADVHRRIEEVWMRIEESKRATVTTLKERLDIRKEEDDKEREERRIKRQEENQRAKEAREKADKVKTEYGEDVRIEGEHDEDDMMAQMGFTGFGAPNR